MARQDCCFVLRPDRVTAAFEKRGGERGYLLWTLTNTRPTPAAVVVQLEGGRGVRLALLPFQKMPVHQQALYRDGLRPDIAASERIGLPRGALVADTPSTDGSRSRENSKGGE